MSEHDEVFYYYQCAEHVTSGEVHCNRFSKQPSSPPDKKEAYTNFCQFSLPVADAHHVSLREMAIPFLVPSLTMIQRAYLLTNITTTGEERFLKAEFPGKTVQITHTN